MVSSSSMPHAVMIPYPAQGHITPMLQLAKLLHLKGFYITFVNTEYNHRRLQRSRGSDSTDNVEGFRFEAIPDGMPTQADVDVTQDIPQLCVATRDNCGVPFRELLIKLGSSQGVPPVSCVISDGAMSFTLEVTEELGITEVVFWTISACAFMSFVQYPELIKRGYTPLKDQSYLTNGYLETAIEWIPGMKNIRLKDIPSFIRTTDRNDTMLNFVVGEVQNAFKASALILNTFDELECEVLDELKTTFPKLYTVGPLPALVNQQTQESCSKSIGSNLWREDTRCLEWLSNQEAGSVVYVNFGSITSMTAKQLGELAWGLARSKHKFLWVTRPDLVAGGGPAALPEEFRKETAERGMVVSWCPQERVLSHPAVGVFLTHSGWNSTLESICAGVPMICCPFFADQPTNCRYVCAKWGIGVEIDGDVRREEVEGAVREMMEGEKGEGMRAKARDWKAKAEEAAKRGGSSFKNIDRLVHGLQMGNFADCKNSGKLESLERELEEMEILQRERCISK